MTTLPYPQLDIELSINTKPPTLNFVFPNLGLLAGTVGTINAPGASGKSWLALQLATYLACNFDMVITRSARHIIMSKQERRSSNERYQIYS